MDDNKFFKFIWRVNAISLFLLLFFSVITMGLSIKKRDAFGSDVAVSDAISTDNSNGPLAAKQSILLGEPLPKTSLLSVTARNSRASIFDPSLLTSSKIQTAALKLGLYVDVNHGLLNTNTQETRWVFKNTDQLILDKLRLTENCAMDSCPVKAFAYLVAQKGDSYNSMFHESDGASFWLAKADGTRLTQIAELKGPSGKIEERLKRIGDKIYLQTDFSNSASVLEISMNDFIDVKAITISAPPAQK